MPTMERDAGERERCVTGIDAIDHILNGGIPRGNPVLISGSVGTGKTSICIEFLIRGALEGENSLYLSVTEFFFSSRRRHTRCLSDWSSDVCSSDLPRRPRET